MHRRHAPCLMCLVRVTTTTTTTTRAHSPMVMSRSSRLREPSVCTHGTESHPRHRTRTHCLLRLPRAPPDLHKLDVSWGMTIVANMVIIGSREVTHRATCAASPVPGRLTDEMAGAGNGRTGNPPGQQDWRILIVPFGWMRSGSAGGMPSPPESRGGGRGEVSR